MGDTCVHRRRREEGNNDIYICLPCSHIFCCICHYFLLPSFFCVHMCLLFSFPGVSYKVSYHFPELFSIFPCFFYLLFFPCAFLQLCHYQCFLLLFFISRFTYLNLILWCSSFPSISPLSIVFNPH